MMATIFKLSFAVAKVVRAEILALSAHKLCYNEIRER
jgi:hypothetical protein